MIKLIVGLGNPEEKYKRNRHNIGFNFVDSLAHINNTSWKLEKKFFTVLASITIEIEGTSHKIILAKPTTYMNDSGKAVRALVQFYSLQPSEVLIVHDELDVTLGTTKLKLSGGHGGHNGLRSITNVIGKDYYRLRIGIGRPPAGWEVSNFVLANPSTKEYEVLIEGMLPSIEHIKNIISDPDKAMKLINTKQHNNHEQDKKE